MSKDVVVVGLSRHAYAPEQNRAKLSNGNWIKVPNCLNLAEARDFYENSKKPKPLYAVRGDNGMFTHTTLNPSFSWYG